MRGYVSVTLAITISSFVIFSTTTGAPATARCPRRSLCNDFYEHSAIFVGRVISGSEQVGPGREAGDVRFKVEETFKGDLSAEARVYVSSLDDTAHRVFGLSRDQSYVVFARESSGLLITGMCSRTKPVAEAKSELIFLRSLSTAGAGGRIFGWVEESLRDSNSIAPMADLTVALENAENQRLEAKTNAEGYLEFNGLKPGKYKVIPNWPDHYAGWIEEGSPVIEISGQRCKNGIFRAIAQRKK